jgi:broad specificity phosphatase PhoE
MADTNGRTAAGAQQAYKANAYFKDRYETQKMPYFQSYYTSPLSRCTVTANLTFADIHLPAEHPFIPTVKEGFREGISIHTCDRRSNKVTSPAQTLSRLSGLLLN